MALKHVCCYERMQQPWLSLLAHMLTMIFVSEWYSVQYIFDDDFHIWTNKNCVISSSALIFSGCASSDLSFECKRIFKWDDFLMRALEDVRRALWSVSALEGLYDGHYFNCAWSIRSRNSTYGQLRPNKLVLLYVNSLQNIYLKKRKLNLMKLISISLTYKANKTAFKKSKDVSFSLFSSILALDLSIPVIRWMSSSLLTLELQIYGDCHHNYSLKPSA